MEGLLMETFVAHKCDKSGCRKRRRHDFMEPCLQDFVKSAVEAGKFAEQPLRRFLICGRGFLYGRKTTEMLEFFVKSD